MKVSKDINTDLMTLSELTEERNNLLPKVENNTISVREVRRFIMLHSLIAMFDNAKIASRQIRKTNGNIGNQVKQDLIRAKKNVQYSQKLDNLVLHNGFNGFPASEDINDI